MTGVRHAEQEITIRLDRVTGHAHICSTWPEWSRKLRKLYGQPRKVTQRDGKATSAFWTVPLNRVGLRRGIPRPPMPAARREAARERMRQLHDSRSTPSSKTQKTG